VAKKPVPDFLEILKVLTDHEVDFIVVDGVPRFSIGYISFGCNKFHNVILCTHKKL